MSRDPQNEIVRLVPGSEVNLSCDRCILDRNGRLIGAYESDVYSAEPMTRGVIPVGYGDVVWVPLTSSEFTGGDDHVLVEGPSWWSALGIFALGWAGGYLAWVAIGRYQAKKEMATTSSPIWKKNRNLPPFDPSKDSFASQQKYMPRNKRINKKWWE